MTIATPAKRKRLDPVGPLADACASLTDRTLEQGRSHSAMENSSPDQRYAEKRFGNVYRGRNSEDIPRRQSSYPAHGDRRLGIGLRHGAVRATRSAQGGVLGFS